MSKYLGNLSFAPTIPPPSLLGRMSPWHWHFVPRGTGHLVTHPGPSHIRPIHPSSAILDIHTSSHSRHFRRRDCPLGNGSPGERDREIRSLINESDHSPINLAPQKVEPIICHSFFPKNTFLAKRNWTRINKRLLILPDWTALPALIFADLRSGKLSNALA